MHSFLQLQSEKLWKVRDQLQSSLSQAELKSMLEANSQEIPSGESRVSIVDWGVICLSKLSFLHALTAASCWMDVQMAWCLELWSRAALARGS